MIYFIRKYWKYILASFCAIILFVSICIYNTNNKVSTSSDKKLSVTKKSSDVDEVTSRTVFVDVKGAVNAPGVYEIDEDKRIIDAINLAGGLSDNANTINLNLSKKLEDEMYIVVYTKNEIAEYKEKNNSDKEIVCASNECVCPDTKNDACISNEVSTNSASVSNSTSVVNSKVSINTASKDELMSLTGIGEAKAEAIISYRQENGNFTVLEDIKNVSGIGDSVYEKIKDNITL